MNTTSELLETLALETIEVNIFRGGSHDIGSPNVFGGQVLSQSLHAAMLSVPEDRIVHSMHAYFILPGDLTKPIVYEVDKSRDGGSFTTRRVVAIQNGQQIFIMAASFQIKQEGHAHQMDMPDVPPPTELQSEQELMETFKEHLPEAMKKFLRPRPIEFRPVNPYSYIQPTSQEPTRYVWFKALGDVPDDLVTNQRILAYASDYNLLTTAILPHQDKTMPSQLQLASLDHAMWFHHEFKMDEWLLYAIDSPSASNARGFTRGSIYTQSGKLIASVVQEGLMRPKPKRKK
ncbi:UNVERIFIED_CONTAM: hypothetical protein GTU68_057961 [Idotea baltica]|nr:hypothetical protein [Idotea baltica]